MKVNFIFKGTIKCSKCNLEFVPNSKFFKGLDEIIGVRGILKRTCNYP
ncbi:TPA: hypothetical protein SAM09_000170 [Campylobacter jejuni]|nr:hypothetical protein [Campylobacter jejuni]